VPSAGDPQALNRYSYVVNNPIRYSDPTGLCFGEAPVACPEDMTLTEIDAIEEDICCSAPNEPLFQCVEPFDLSLIPLPIGSSAGAVRATNTTLKLGVAAAGACAIYCRDAVDALSDVGLDVPCLNPFGCDAGSNTMLAKDNNGNPLPEGAVKLKGGIGYRTKEGTTYIPNPVRKPGGNHGEMGHEVSRNGKLYRNVRVSEDGKMDPVPGKPGEWQAPKSR
jgi:hypothetical protein